MMTYVKPDFLLVSVKVGDVFSSYCDMKIVETWDYTLPCQKLEENIIYQTAVEAGYGSRCFVNNTQ